MNGTYIYYQNNQPTPPLKICKKKRYVNGNLQRFPDVPLGVEIVTHGPVAVVVVVVADPEVDPGQEESQYPHCPVAWCDP